MDELTTPGFTYPSLEQTVTAVLWKAERRLVVDGVRVVTPSSHYGGEGGCLASGLVQSSMGSDSLCFHDRSTVIGIPADVLVSPITCIREAQTRQE